MRATWLTAALSGILFASVVAWAGPRGLSPREPAGVATVLIKAGVVVVFLVTTVFGVFGLALFREMRAEQRARGLGPMGQLADAGDYRRFHRPLWGRMLAFFVCVAVSAVVWVLARR